MTVLHGKMTFDGLAKRALADANQDARKLRAPDSDIEPRIYLYAPSSETLHVHDVRQGFTGPEARAELMRRTVTLIKIGGVNLVAIRYGGYEGTLPADLTEAEMVMVERNVKPDRVVSPRQLPESERREVAIITVFDPEVVKGWRSLITRRIDRAPKFGPWRSDLNIGGGVMIDPIFAAMR